VTAWLVVLVGGLASFGLRWLPARWTGGRRLPAAIERSFASVGPAAFAALAAPAVVLPAAAAAPVGARIAAVAVAAPVARTTRSTMATLAVGMPVLWLASVLLAP
jgi:branched-subunit amino acid transport protein